MDRVKKIFKGRVLDISLETITLPNGNDVDLEIIRHPGGHVRFCSQGRRCFRHD